MSRPYANLLVVFLASCVWACSDDDAATSSKHAGTEAQHRAAEDAASQLSAADDAGPVRDAGSGPKASVGNDDDAFIPPANSSFESARVLSAGEDTMQRVVNDSQVDYYSFEAKAGVFYVLSTTNGRYSPNNVLTVFDPDREMIAENDDGSFYPNDNIDTRLVIRPQRSGTYYVVLEDRSSMGAESDGRFIPPLFYTLSLREITSDTEGFAIEQDDKAPSSLHFAHDDMAHARYITLLGTLSDKDTSDTFEIHGMPDYALIGQLMAAGKRGDSSTAEAISLRVTADSDGHMLARGGSTSGQRNIHPPVDDASYKIEVTAGDNIGKNGYYAIDIVLVPDNPHERSEPANNSIEGAEPITLSGVGSLRGLLLSRLPADDVDYYRFDAQAGQFTTLGCEGETGGSGVRGLKVELLGPDMKSLAEASETSSKQLSIKPLKLDMAGTYYIKLTSKTPAVHDGDADAIEPWARCAVLVGR